MSVVLDSSVALAWCFEDELTDPLRHLLQHVSEHGALVPSLWRYEVANGLQISIKRKRIGEVERDRQLSNLAILDIRLDEQCESLAWSVTVKLSALYGLTVYNAAFLELAQRCRLLLATLDAALAQAARAAGVDLAL